MKHTSLTEFYQELTACTGTEVQALLPQGIQQDVGHFNVFNLTDLWQPMREKPVEPYACRAYYKISLLHGRSRAEYPHKVLDIEQNTLLFSTPKVPYYWLPQDPGQAGCFCVFTADFLQPTKSGVVLDELPLFKTEVPPAFPLSVEECTAVAAIFHKMQEEIASDYAYKYDLLRNYVLELLHFGQKRQPATALHPAHSAAARLTSLFIELLERQFPLESPQQRLCLRTATDYADQLAVHVNHLNKVLKETTGRTTTDLIASRIVQEAQVLLKQTHWTILEIADSLGFADVAHFSNFFKRQTAVTPGVFRS
ncbi:helix-turn-helix domain-containing protein [Hymenobacter weizhouensis]|uniref:helix-turn-helix domain-containing protein n=1 Tax=Hymenobacter sp. YIM 151500-1 TaxID=2987689 RepID=UPI002225ED48|nr:helix-turn-helix transcriptional regulator [Hymenobacter sp. YIM 151500-1]UYZ63096.1 helix-turn-helix transcriptional regulator [Hymenobacter sp. YIM 151500-1]